MFLEIMGGTRHRFLVQSSWSVGSSLKVVIPAGKQRAPAKHCNFTAEGQSRGKLTATHGDDSTRDPKRELNNARMEN